MSDPRLPQQCVQRTSDDSFERELSVRHNRNRLRDVNELAIQKQAVALDSLRFYIDAIRRDDSYLELGILPAFDPLVVLRDEIIGKGSDGVSSRRDAPNRTIGSGWPRAQESSSTATGRGAVCLTR